MIVAINAGGAQVPGASQSRHKPCHGLMAAPQGCLCVRVGACDRTGLLVAQRLKFLQVLLCGLMVAPVRLKLLLSGIDVAQDPLGVGTEARFELRQSLLSLMEQPPLPIPAKRSGAACRLALP